ncbi:hypothetical protein [Thermoflexibacter ruber]|nr:hypothetical protein [Thermoflexibacter ruber]
MNEYTHIKPRSGGIFHAYGVAVCGLTLFYKDDSSTGLKLDVVLFIG